MPKKKPEDVATSERFERALRKALATPLGEPIVTRRKKANRKKKGAKA